MKELLDLRIRRGSLSTAIRNSPRTRYRRVPRHHQPSLRSAEFAGNECLRGLASVVLAICVTQNCVWVSLRKSRHVPPDASTIAREDLPFLLILAQLLTQARMTAEDGSVVEFADVVRQLQQDTVSNSVSIGVRGRFLNYLKINVKVGSMTSL